MLGRPVWDVRADTLPEVQRSSEAYQELKDSMLGFFQTGTASWLLQFEDRELIWPDGQLRFVQRIRVPICTERGFMLVSISRDVTDNTRRRRNWSSTATTWNRWSSSALLNYSTRSEERLKVEEVLRESEGRYRALVNQAPLSILVAQDGRYVFANPAIVQRLGYSSAYELIGKTMIDTIAPKSQEYFRGRQDHVLRGGPGEPVITAFRCKDGGVYYSENTSVPILYQGRPAVLLIGQDVTERMRYEQQLKSSLSEKEVMLREIHHRVKNNLNVIIALIDLQKAVQSDPQVLLVFKELQTRVYSMALAHESLFRSPNLARIDISGYLQTLVSYLYSAYGPTAAMPGRSPIQYHVEAENVTLKIETAIPCGLIVNELVTNAMKYAFPTGFVSREASGCQITVQLERVAGGSGNEPDPGELCLKLTIHDNGIGLASGFDWRATTTLGLQLVQVLVRQLGGQIELETENGVTWGIIILPSESREREMAGEVVLVVEDEVDYCV